MAHVAAQLDSSSAKSCKRQNKRASFGLVRELYRHTAALIHKWRPGVTAPRLVLPGYRKGGAGDRSQSIPRTRHHQHARVKMETRLPGVTHHACPIGRSRAPRVSTRRMPSGQRATCRYWVAVRNANGLAGSQYHQPRGSVHSLLEPFVAQSSGVGMGEAGGLFG